MKRAFLTLFLMGCSNGLTTYDSASPTPLPNASANATPSSTQQEISREACISQAQAEAQQWKTNGLDERTLELRFQEALASCSGDTVDPNVAWLMGRVNWDYTQLARLLVARQLDGSTYVGRVRDRTRKRKLAQQDAARLGALVQGDEDEDLVPDSVDQCPGTERLAATTDEGCPVATPPAMSGSQEDLHLYFQKMGVVAGMGCQGAPTPEVPVPLRAGRSSDGRTLVAVTPIENQPADCPVMIEIEGTYTGSFQWTGPGPGSSFGSYRTIHLVLRSTHVLRATADELVFAAGQGDTEFLNTAQQSGWTYKLEWRARAMNGNGALSPWSAPRITRDFSLQ